MLDVKFRGERMARALRAAAPLLVFIGPVIVFLGLMLFRAPAPPPVRRGEASNEARPGGVTPGAEKAQPGAGGNGALLEPLRPKTLRAKPTEKIASDCAVADPSSGLVTVAAEETPIMLGPAATAKPLKDWNGAQRFLDPRHDLKILDASGAWVRVSVVGPNWPPGNVGWSGWIERKHIQQTDAPDARHCLFVDPGKWLGLPAAVQSAAKSAALQILRQDERCRRISRGGYLGNGQRFYLTCYPGDGARPYHYWLSATNPRKNFVAPAPADEDAAMLKCRGELQKALSGQAMIEGREASEASIETFQARRSGAVHQISLEYRIRDDELQKAYCLVAPGGGAEITLGDPS
jgi:hypothetical protein